MFRIALLDFLPTFFVLQFWKAALLRKVIQMSNPRATCSLHHWSQFFRLCYAVKIGAFFLSWHYITSHQTTALEWRSKTQWLSTLPTFLNLGPSVLVWRTPSWCTASALRVVARLCGSFSGQGLFQGSLETILGEEVQLELLILQCQQPLLCLALGRPLKETEAAWSHHIPVLSH